MIFLKISFLFIGMTEVTAIAAICLLLFGGKKVPELMKGLGSGVKEFKKGMNEVLDTKEPDSNTPKEE
jgi:sec-independent protein translocase protein TatA